MKFVPYRVKIEGLSTPGLLALVAAKGDHQQGGILVDEVRQRVRILDALNAQDENGPGLLLEDADHDLLKRLINQFPFGMANADLLRIIDDVLDAKAPPPRVPDAAEPMLPGETKDAA